MSGLRKRGRAAAARVIASLVLLLALAPGTGRGTAEPSPAVGAGDLEAGPAAADFRPGLEPARAGKAIDAGLPYRPERIGFPLRVDGAAVPYRVLAAQALPGQTLEIRAGAAAGSRRARLRHGSGVVAQRGSGTWRWTAPHEPGIHALRVVVSAPADSAWLNVLVLYPRSAIRGGVLNGYRIGDYPSRPLRSGPAHELPRGFAELTPADADVLVSPHFTLGQFACKQPGNPRYLALTRALVLKLEATLEEVNRSGRAAPTLHVMSGYRTPAYNRSIGNRTSYSRHLWGDAADVFVDIDGDGQMDDWTGDGRSDYRDARILVGLVEKAVERGGARVRPGGLSLYRRNPSHGPFVHLDARGYRARW